MREKLQTLSLAVLKDFAKDKKIKNFSTMKKSDLIEAIIAATENEGQADNKEYKTEVKAEVKEMVPAEETAEEKTELSEDEKYKKRQEILEQNVVVDPVPADGILEVMPDGYGFIRCENFLPGADDVYVSPAQIKRIGLKTGDILVGKKRVKTQGEKFAALLELDSVNGYDPEVLQTRPNFEKLTPIFPNQRIHLEKGNPTTAMRIVDLMCPIGKGQRGMIVSQPKAGKTTLLKQIASAVLKSNPEMHMID